MTQQYSSRYPKWIEDAEKSLSDLPENLQYTIEQFLIAKEAWETSGKDTQNRLLPILIQSDAIISAAIYRLYYSTSVKSDLDNIRLLALRAKALRMRK